MLLSLNNKTNITLCGMMGSGKTIVGKILAKKIGFSFIDTDKVIEEKSGKSINTIFNEHGEEYFRVLEKKIITEILEKQNYVISLGGGSIEHKSIRKVIKNKSYNIYLEVCIDVLIKRLSKSKNRPLIYNKDINQTLNKLIIKREKFYKKANLIVKNNISINAVVENIVNKINNHD